MSKLSEKEIVELTDILLNIGESLLISGSDISRVENTIEHISKSYKIDNVDVYVITSLVVITIKDGDFIYTESRRVITRSSNNFQIIEDLNNLSRSLNTRELSVSELREEYQKIVSKKKNDLKTILGYVLASSSFALFFGDVIDAIGAGLMAIEIYYSSKLLYKYCSNHAFFMFLISLLNGLLITGVCYFIPSLDVNNIIIGDMMLLIPGASITLAFQNTLIGDTTSGINQFIESLLWSLAIAAGYGLAILIVGVF